MTSTAEEARATRVAAKRLQLQRLGAHPFPAALAAGRMEAVEMHTTNIGGVVDVELLNAPPVGEFSMDLLVDGAPCLSCSGRLITVSGVDSVAVYQITDIYPDRAIAKRLALVTT